MVSTYILNYSGTAISSWWNWQDITGCNWYGCQDTLGIDGNEKADKLSRQGSSHPLTGHELALGVSAKVAREVIRG